MDYPLVIGILVVLVVGFFAYQWMSKRKSVTGYTGPVKRGISPSPSPSPTTSSPPPVQKDEKFPVIAGQTQAEALTKEPDQRRELSSQQPPALHNGEAPAKFDQHLRHPEQLFHQPAEPQAQGQDSFSPEMAQNGGAFLGNSVFAYDGMEPTGFTAF